MVVYFGILFFLLGAVFGSFFNVIIYRLPESISIVRPPSHCPGCGEKVRWQDNIPIVSYIVLNGKCRNCDFHIPLNYLVVETVSAFLFLYAYLHLGLTFELFTFLIFVSLLIPISFIDLKTTYIPDSLSIAGIVIGLILSIFRGLALISLIGAVVGAVLILVIIVVGKAAYKKDVMGYGDIKLAALIGAFVGWAGLLLTIMIGSFLGAVYGLIQIKRGKLKMESQIPFGPYLAIGGVISFLYGKWIIVKLFLP
jgi:leader peptidase (prepilin peptidase) / N-methyltransferase